MAPSVNNQFTPGPLQIHPMAPRKDPQRIGLSPEQYVHLSTRLNTEVVSHWPWTPIEWVHFPSIITACWLRVYWRSNARSLNQWVRSSESHKSLPIYIVFAPQGPKIAWLEAPNSSESSSSPCSSRKMCPLFLPKDTMFASMSPCVFVITFKVEPLGSSLCQLYSSHLFDN